MYLLRTDTAGKLNPATLINKTVIRENSCRNSIAAPALNNMGQKQGLEKCKLHIISPRYLNQENNINYIIMIIYTY